MNVEGTDLIKGNTGFTLIACFSFRGNIHAVDHLGKYSCAGGFADTTGSAKKVGMTQMIIFNSIFKGSSDGMLSDYR
ncbi:unnamed protein product [marine sediment metagenome]|uniref:Uncharacterized protein n=1 Tax=marine sediment metagenome TaxID=412755 RepID=X0W8A0_9ZZZZ